MIPPTVRVGLARTHRLWERVAIGCAIGAALLAAVGMASRSSWPTELSRPPSLAPVAEHHPVPSPAPGPRPGGPAALIYP